VALSDPSTLLHGLIASPTIQAFSHTFPPSSAAPGVQFPTPPFSSSISGATIVMTVPTPEEPAVPPPEEPAGPQMDECGHGLDHIIIFLRRHFCRKPCPFDQHLSDCRSSLSHKTTIQCSQDWEGQLQRMPLEAIQ
jgi:hypothetical protein